VSVNEMSVKKSNFYFRVHYYFNKSDRFTPSIYWCDAETRHDVL